MANKYKNQRLQLHVQEGNNYMRREEYVSCRMKGCRNVIASWAVRKTGQAVCTPCTHTRRTL